MSDPVEKKYDYDMSMEDILSSIRKYVSDEPDDDVKSNDDGRRRPEIDVSDSGDEVFVSLDESQLTSDVDVGEDDEKELPEQKAEERNDFQQPFQQAFQQQKRSASGGAFNKLADALKAYGKNEVKSVKKPSSEVTMSQFLTLVSGKIIEDWVDKNLRKIVEEIVLREIEKIKSE